MINQTYYIWSFEHKGWWKSSRRGYSENLSDAGLYFEEAAHKILNEANFLFDSGRATMPNEALVPAIQV